MILPALGFAVMAMWSPIAPAAPALSATRHAIHSTLTVARIERGALELRIRVFADDFSTSVASSFGRPAPMDSSVSGTDADHYVQQRLLVRDARGGRVALVSCGLERVREVYLICYRAVPSGSVALAKVENRLLMELHDDQVNIVQFVVGTTKRSSLLTRESATAVIPTG